MSNKISIIIIFFITLILSGCSYNNSLDKATETPFINENVYLNLLECHNYDDMLFQKSVGEAIVFPVETLSAGVVPHHLLAGDLIASFFRTVMDSGQTYDTVIIIGPNHNGKGAAVSLADRGWRTPFGQLACDNEIVSQVLARDSLGAGIDNGLLESDQADSTIIPFVGYYLPDVKIVTVLLSRNVKQNQCRDLAGIISQISFGKNILLVGSIDFSHGLTSKEAGKKDEETEKAILNNNLDLIKTMGNENLDSPETLCTLLYYMASRGAEQPVILSHGSAADYLPEPDPCTSYFVLGCP